MAAAAASRRLRSGSALLSMAAADQAHAQAWPSRTITAIIPFAAGNANDIVARIVLDQVSKQVGQTIVIDNRAGGGGIIGVAAVGARGARRLHHAGAFLLVQRVLFAAQEPALRHLQGFRRGGPARLPADGAGGRRRRSRGRRWASSSPRPRPSPARSTSPPPASAPPRISPPSASASAPASRRSTFRSRARSRRSPK